MAARVTPYSAQILRARQSALPVPPAHRGAMLSSLIWSLSTPSASLPYLKPTPCPAPAFSQVIKRGMSTIQKVIKVQDPDDEEFARFHRAVRDESESYIDMWSLPLETLGTWPSLQCHRWSVSSPWLVATCKNLPAEALFGFLSNSEPVLTRCVTSDVHLPSFPARVENATLRDHIALLRDNFLNTLKNISRCATPLPDLSKP